jgi:peptidoglycan/LPS O-acetylase OafA/YrhL
MVLEDRDIALINVIMSLGLILFLSLLNLHTQGNSNGIISLFHGTIVIVFPFLISMIVTLLGYRRLSKWLTITSFGWLFAWFILVFISLLQTF